MIVWPLVASCGSDIAYFEDPNKSQKTSARLRYITGLFVKRTWEWIRTLDLVLGWPALLAGARQLIVGGESMCTLTWSCR